MLSMFADAFGERETYLGAQPDDGYLTRLLDGDRLIALAAVEGDCVIGGLVAYVLEKFEQARSEIYIYDLAVSEAHRRKGVATRLIEDLKPIAKAHGAHVLFIQAERDNAPAAALYTKFAANEDILHFEIKMR